MSSSSTKSNAIDVRVKWLEDLLRLHSIWRLQTSADRDRAHIVHQGEHTTEKQRCLDQNRDHDGAARPHRSRDEHSDHHHHPTDHEQGDREQGDPGTLMRDRGRNDQQPGFDVASRGMPGVTTLDGGEEHGGSDPLGIQFGGDRQRRWIIRIHQDVRRKRRPLERDLRRRWGGHRIDQFEPDLSEPAFSGHRKQREKPKVWIVDLELLDGRFDGRAVDGHRMGAPEEVLQ